MKEQKVIPWGWAGKDWMGGVWKRYKLNHSDFKEILEEQGGKCAGCREDFAHPTIKDMQRFGLRPEIDHKHVEGRSCERQDVRGLLCRRCNDFLGKIQDNEATLQNLVNYLKKHGDWSAW